MKVDDFYDGGFLGIGFGIGLCVVVVGWEIEN